MRILPILLCLFIASSAEATTYTYSDLGGYTHINLYRPYPLPDGFVSTDPLESVVIDDSGPHPVVTVNAHWKDWSIPGDPSAPFPYRDIRVVLIMTLFYDFEGGAHEGFDENTGHFFSNNGAAYILNVDGVLYPGFTGYTQNETFMQLVAGEIGKTFEIYIFRDLKPNWLPDSNVELPEPSSLFLGLLGFPLWNLNRKFS